MFRGRVMFARARGRTLRRLERNARTGETFLPRPGRLRDGLPVLPVTDTGRARLRAMPGGRSARPAGPVQPVDGPTVARLRPVADDDGDDSTDRPDQAA